jgi:hypothetical protein
MLREGLLDLVLTHVAGSIERYEVVPLVKDDICRRRPQEPSHLRGAVHGTRPRPLQLGAAALLGHPAWLNAVLARHNCPPPQAQLEATSILYLPG